MERQAVLRDLDLLAEAGTHHPPADDRLEGQEAGRDRDLPSERALERPADPEPERRENERRADDAGEQPMAPFPPEDGLEAFQGHVGIAFGVLRDLLVTLELRLPVRRVQGRQDPGDRLPLGDGEARLGQPGRAADEHHGEDERGDRDEPDADAREEAEGAVARRLRGKG